MALLLWGKSHRVRQSKRRGRCLTKPPDKYEEKRERERERERVRERGVELNNIFREIDMTVMGLIE